jgi:hypothetical protein
MANFKLIKGKFVQVDEEGVPIPRGTTFRVPEEKKFARRPGSPFDDETGGRFEGAGATRDAREIEDQLLGSSALQTPGTAPVGAAIKAGKELGLFDVARNPRVQSAATEAATTFATTGSPLAAAGAGAVGAAFPGGEEESIAAAGGEVSGLKLAQRLLPAKLRALTQAGEKLSRGARAGQAARQAAPNVAAAAGAGVGFGVGKALKDKFLGQSAELPGGGSIFFQSASVTAGGLSGIILGTGLSKVMRVVNETPERALVRTTNLVRKGELSDTQGDLAFGLQQSVARPRLSARTAQNFSEKIRDDFFPTQSTTDEVLAIKGKLQGFIERGALQGGISNAAVRRKTLNELRLDKKNLEVIQEAMEAPEEDFLGVLFSGRMVESSKRMVSLKRLMVDKGLDPEGYEKLATDWLRNSMLGEAMTTATKDLGEGFERVLDGKKFRDTITQIPDELNAMFGPGRAQALLKLSEVMDKIDPSKTAVNPLAAGAKASLWYLGRKVLFAGTIGAGVGGSVASAAGSLAGASVFMLGVAPMAMAVLSDPTLPLKLERALQEPTGRALTGVMRAIASGEQSGPIDDLPPLSR